LEPNFMDGASKYFGLIGIERMVIKERYLYSFLARPVNWSIEQLNPNA